MTETSARNALPKVGAPGSVNDVTNTEHAFTQQKLIFYSVPPLRTNIKEKKCSALPNDQKITAEDSPTTPDLADDTHRGTCPIIRQGTAL